MNKRSITTAGALLLAITLTGCAGRLPVSDIDVTTYKSGDGWLNASFYIIEHPFTDDGTARAKTKAQQLCGEYRQVAVPGERACSMEKCTTNYVCMKPEDAKSSGLPQ